VVAVAPLRRGRANPTASSRNGSPAHRLTFLGDARHDGRHSERIGYAAEFRDLLLTRRVQRRAVARARPRVEEYAALAEAAGLTVGDDLPRLTALPEERAHGEALAPDGPYAVIAPGASYGPAKRWDPERFATLGRALHAQEGMGVVLVGQTKTGKRPPPWLSSSIDRGGSHRGDGSQSLDRHSGPVAAGGLE